MTNENVKEIASIAWKGAANAHRMYPDNKHTFNEYWIESESQFNKFYNHDVSRRLPNAEDVKRWYQLLVGESEIELQKDIDTTLCQSLKAEKWDDFEK